MTKILKLTGLQSFASPLLGNSEPLRQDQTVRVNDATAEKLMGKGRVRDDDSFACHFEEVAEGSPITRDLSSDEVQAKIAPAEEAPTPVAAPAEVPVPAPEFPKITKSTKDEDADPVIVKKPLARQRKAGK